MSMRKLLYLLSITLLASCGMPSTNEQAAKTVDSLRIVSINGTVSEVLASLGLADQIVGVDVTSTYPERLKDRPKVGHNRNLSMEGILSLEPDLVIGTTSDIKPEAIKQLQQTGIHVQLFDRTFSPDGTKALIRQVGDSLDLKQTADSLLQQLDDELEKVSSFAASSPKPRVLFIYARGAGTMMVGGSGTPIDEMITLAGGDNVAKDLEEYKPLTPEALVKYNPDVILLFDSGLSSLGNIDGILTVKGVSETNAGKNKKIVEMDGQLLSGFGPRLATAIDELYHKIH